MYLNVLIFPFLGSIIAGLFGKIFGRAVIRVIAVFCIFITFLVSLFIFYEVGLSQNLVVIELFS
jgi:NADH:ubiquinone oxidoreductase subunit 5 (subunit L)/multisubunit Na+/H+ antiporter MnhA subunit